MNQRSVQSDVRVEFRGVSKIFRRGEDHGSLRDALPALARRILGGKSEDAGREFLSLDDVSFQARAGECLGIIGPNGAGKSTVLKCASRILRPNAGAVTVRGRVSALIEVGAGFHPDLTGRENIYLYGAVLGMRRREVSERFDRIVSFSGIGAAIDTPAKRYSSGMFARLGFAVAALMDPDVLLIDEVLSVGDRAFSEQCERKIHEILANGAAVLFVSHNLASVRMICDRVVVLENGRLTFEGPADDAIHHYHESFRRQQGDADGSARSCDCEIRVLDAAGREVETLQPGEAFLIDVAVTSRESVSDARIVILFHDEHEQLVYQCEGGSLTGRAIGLSPGLPQVLRFRLVANLLPGTYWIGSEIRGQTDPKKPLRLLDDRPRRLPLTVVGVGEAVGTANLFATCRHGDPHARRASPLSLRYAKEA